MLHGLTSPGVAGSELTRLLARLADAPPADTRPAFAERLGQWLSWTGAISLSAALNAGTSAPPAGRKPNRQDGLADVQRVRGALAEAIAAGPSDTVLSPNDFSPFLRHCTAQQQAMQKAVAALRQGLRAALEQQSPQGARLAALDAVLDERLAAQERHLLGLVPLRLQAHFERLQRSTGDQPAAMLRTFTNDLHDVLLAELEHRLLPAQGLAHTLKLFETP
jgi:Protein of unknown function (DUF3348)